MSQQGILSDQTSAGSDIETLTGDTGGVVGPDGAFNIDILGGDTTTITGSPGTNTLTVDASTSGYPITPYVVGPAGQAGYTTIQDALDAADAAGGGIVGVQPGTYTENLTLYDATQVVGFGSNSSINGGGGAIGQIIITGTHTPPLSGSFIFKNVTFTSSGSVIFTAAVGTTTINVEECVIGTISGYLFDLDNFGGELSLINSTNPGLGNRGINNTVGSNVFILHSELGSFGSSSSNLGGTYRFENSTCRVPIAFLDGSDTIFNNGAFLSGFTTAGASEVDVYESLIQHLSSSSIVHNSDSEVNVNNCTVSSSTNPAIDGSGIGQLNLTAIDFPLNSSIAATLTLGSGTSYSGTYKSDYTDHGVILGQGAATNMVATTAGADGQLLIGATAGDPSFASLTSTGDTITITEGTNTLNVDLSSSVQSTAIHGWNGSIVETAAVTVTSDGATITCSVQQNGGGDLTVVFSDGFYAWDTTPADTVSLTAGTDSAPQTNYIYFLQSTKTLTNSTSGFPATEHAPIATVIAQSATSLQTEGAYKVHAWTDHITSTSDQGHIPDLNSWIRSQDATWISGVTQTFSITTNVGVPDNVLLTTAIGVVRQLHSHSFPAFSGTPDYYVINDSVTPYTVVTDLNALLTDSTGASLSGKYFSLVLWGVVSEDSGDSKIFINLPSGSYNNAPSLAADPNGFATFDIPQDYIGTGFLIAQWNLRHSVASGGTWTSQSEIDLRGFEPGIFPGGTVTTPTEFADNLFRIFDDGDPTKEIAFEASSITTATTRTITMADYDLDLATVANSIPTDSGTATPAAGVLTIAGGTNINTSGAASTATINLDGDVLGLTDLTVDNLELNGNTLSSTDTNGSILISPDGTGGAVIPTNLTIGETVQDVTFTINGASIDGRLAVHADGVSDLGGFVEERHSDTAGFGAHTINLRSRGDENSPTIVSSGDSLSRNIIAGYDGTDYAQAAEIRSEVDGTPGANDMPGRLRFFTSPDGSQTPTEALRLDSSQDATFYGAVLPNGDRAESLGSATNSWDNVYADGITFDDGSNIMSAYEEGTWTPTLAFGGGSTGITYSSQTGNYTKIGNVVFIQCNISLSSKGTDTGDATLTLPISTGAGASSSLNMQCTTFTAITLGSTYSVISIALQTSSTSANINRSDPGGGGAYATLSDSAFSNTSLIRFSGFYFV